MGSTWIGLVLMVSVTSLPELITGVSAVTIANTPDITIGNVLGSNLLDTLILMIDDILYTRGPLLPLFHHSMR